MSPQVWWLYVGAVAVISATPGPNMFFVMTRSIRFGFGRAAAGVAGCLLALFIMLAASAAGLGALLLGAPALFDVLKYAGAAYLVYLGLRTWRAEDPSPDAEAASVAPRDGRPGALFRTGFLIGISNPKLLAFAAALFPQFLDQTAPRVPQFAILVATFLALELVSYTAYGLSAQRLGRHLARGVWRRRLNRASGTVFMAFGVMLFRFRPNG